ncbi:MAG: hypothetical protein AAGL69_05895 [Pseudomonadota bacterium]
MQREILTLSLTTLVVGLLTLGSSANAMHHEGDGLAKAVSAELRDGDKPRDQFRHPAETLKFFGIKPTMTVGEYGPGGGWYTRILAPWISKSGTYVAINADVEKYHAGAPAERNAERKLFPETFPGKVAEWTGVDASSIAAVEIDEAPDWEGKLDAFLIFRSLHGLSRKNLADETAKHAYTLLKAGGIVGVVQHRAKEDAPWDYTRGHNGYLKQSEVIALFESAGFELMLESEINANPNDTADWDGGVWSLPPTLRHGDEDRDTYEAVGESDRMTLVFRKPA